MTGISIAVIYAVGGENPIPPSGNQGGAGHGEREEGSDAAAVESGPEWARADAGRRSGDDSASPDLWMYRERTVGLLKRYCRLSVEMGRLPSLLGREFFRSRVTSYHMSTFEDVVVFVHDVERSLEKLDRLGQQLIGLIVLEEYSQPDAARIVGYSLRTIERYFPEALDRLSQIFLAGGVLRSMVRAEEKICQEVKAGQNRASCCERGKNIF